MSDYITAYEDSALRADINFQEGLPFFHVEVKRDLNKSDIKLARMAFDEIKSSLLKMGYEQLFAYTPSRHFARLVGGGFIDIPVEGVEENMQLIVWELNEV
jgi:hypothetical protein